LGSDQSTVLQFARMVTIPMRRTHAHLMGITVPAGFRRASLSVPVRGTVGADADTGADVDGMVADATLSVGVDSKAEGLRAEGLTIADGVLMVADQWAMDSAVALPAADSTVIRHAAAFKVVVDTAPVASTEVAVVASMVAAAIAAAVTVAVDIGKS